MQTLPLGPSVELPVEPLSASGRAVKVGPLPWGPCLRSLRWISAWGHETCEGHAE